MVSYLSDPGFHPPKSEDRQISELLHADDAVIPSRTPVGLGKALEALAQYFSSKDHLLKLSESCSSVAPLCFKC